LIFTVYHIRLPQRNRSPLGWRSRVAATCNNSRAPRTSSSSLPFPPSLPRSLPLPLLHCRCRNHLAQRTGRCRRDHLSSPTNVLSWHLFPPLDRQTSFTHESHTLVLQINNQPPPAEHHSSPGPPLPLTAPLTQDPAIQIVNNRPPYRPSLPQR